MKLLYLAGSGYLAICIGALVLPARAPLVPRRRRRRSPCPAGDDWCSPASSRSAMPSRWISPTSARRRRPRRRRRGLQRGVLRPGGQDRLGARRDRAPSGRRTVARGRHRVQRGPSRRRRGRRQVRRADHGARDRLPARQLHGAVPRRHVGVRAWPARRRTHPPPPLPRALHQPGRLALQRRRKSSSASATGRDRAGVRRAGHRARRAVRDRRGDRPGRILHRLSRPRPGARRRRRAQAPGASAGQRPARARAAPPRGAGGTRTGASEHRRACTTSSKTARGASW